MKPTQIVILVIAIVVILVLIVVGLIVSRRRALRQKFGPEYDRVVAERDNRSAAERELRERERKHAELELRPLSEKSRMEYAKQWAAVQARFVDAPEETVREGDTLVTRLVGEIGYPTDNYDERLATLSVEHSRTLGHYRDAHEIFLRTERGEASTEQLRQALVHYRALFAELLGDDPLAAATAQHRRTSSPVQTGAAVTRAGRARKPTGVRTTSGPAKPTCAAKPNGVPTPSGAPKATGVPTPRSAMEPRHARKRRTSAGPKPEPSASRARRASAPLPATPTTGRGEVAMRVEGDPQHPGYPGPHSDEVPPPPPPDDSSSHPGSVAHAGWAPPEYYTPSGERRADIGPGDEAPGPVVTGGRYDSGSGEERAGGTRAEEAALEDVDDGEFPPDDYVAQQDRARQPVGEGTTYGRPAAEAAPPAAEATSGEPAVGVATMPGNGGVSGPVPAPAEQAPAEQEPAHFERAYIQPGQAAAAAAAAGQPVDWPAPAGSGAGPADAEQRELLQAHRPEAQAEAAQAEQDSASRTRSASRTVRAIRPDAIRTGRHAPGRGARSR